MINEATAYISVLAVRIDPAMPVQSLDLCVLSATVPRHVTVVAVPSALFSA